MLRKSEESASLQKNRTPILATRQCFPTMLSAFQFPSSGGLAGLRAACESKIRVLEGSHFQKG